MNQQKRPAANGPSENSKTTFTNSFAWIPTTREAVLRVARVETHAERAGFRRPGGGRWLCGVHDDHNPSCSIKGGVIRCWTCNQSWNVIDLEMLATGKPFLKALRVLAAEYGIVTGERALSAEGRNRARAAMDKFNQDRLEARYFKRAAVLLAIGELEVLEVTDPLRFHLTRMMDDLRYDLDATYRYFKATFPRDTAGMVHAGRESERRAHLRLIDIIRELSAEGATHER